MTADPRIARAARDAEWLAHRYDPGHDAVHLLRVARAVHGRVTFITDEHLPAGAERLVVRRADAIAAAPPPAPLHFIWHSAFCCSTLLARALDAPGSAMGLKEPVILNDISGWRQRGGEAKAVATVLGDALRLLARPFAAGEAVVVKPSNVVNPLAPAIMAMAPATRAVLLHAPLAVYLGSVARKGLDGRLWVRDLLIKLRRDRAIDLGFGDDDYLALTDLQVAAVGWLAQHALFARLIARWPERVRSLDSETLVARPAEALAALGALFGLRLDAATIAAGPVFASEAKAGGAFDAGRRTRQARDDAALYADEIGKVAVWARAVAANAGVEMRLGSALLP